jgi:hypothetical protein
MSNEESSGGISRRTIVKGAAWSAPVIAAAIATPLAAASVGPFTVAWTGAGSNISNAANPVYTIDGTNLGVFGPPYVFGPTGLSVTNSTGVDQTNVTVRFTVEAFTPVTASGTGVVRFRGHSPRSYLAFPLVTRSQTPRQIYDANGSTLFSTDTVAEFTIGTIPAGSNLGTGAVPLGVTDREGVAVPGSLNYQSRIVATFYSNGNPIGSAAQQISGALNSGLF